MSMQCKIPALVSMLMLITVLRNSCGIGAGVYVGFGSFLAFTVGANLQEMAISNPGLQKFLYGAVGLPAGLVMVSSWSTHMMETVALG